MRKTITVLLVCLLAFQAFAVTAILSEMFIPGYYYEAEALSGGTATFTDSSTGAPANVYADSSKVTSLGSVVTLDSNGSAVIYGDGTYDIVIKDSDGVTVRTLLGVELEVAGITVPLPIASGGTNATSAGNARTNLGVAIGSDVQAWAADLDTLAASNVAGVYQASSTAPDNSVSVNNSDGDVWFKDDIFIKGDVYVTDDVTIESDLSVSNDIVVGGDLSVNGTVNTMDCQSISMNQQPFCDLRLTGNIIVADETTTNINFGSASSNIGSMYDVSSPTIITIKKDGYYSINANIGIWATDPDNIRACYIRINGEIAAMDNAFAAAGKDGTSVSVARKLSAADYINVTVWHNAGDALTLYNTDATNVQVIRLF